MSKYFQIEKYDGMLSYGIVLNILRPEIILQIDFAYWAVKIGRL